MPAVKLTSVNVVLVKPLACKAWLLMDEEARTNSVLGFSIRASSGKGTVRGAIAVVVSSKRFSVRLELRVFKLEKVRSRSELKLVCVKFLGMNFSLESLRK
jgi:hypothetical protein